MKIELHYNPKPIPDHRFDWDAIIPDMDENSPVCHGKTASEALKNLADEIEDNELWK